MSANKFGIFDENKTNIQTDDEFVAETQRLNGFQPDTAASSKIMNTALRNATLITKSLVELFATTDYLKDVGPNSTLADMKNYFSTGLESWLKNADIVVKDAQNVTSSIGKVTLDKIFEFNNSEMTRVVKVASKAGIADYLNAWLYIILNDTTYDYHGGRTEDENKTVKFYAPTTKGTSGYLLQASASATDGWTYINPDNLTVGNATLAETANVAKKTDKTLTINANRVTNTFDGSKALSINVNDAGDTADVNIYAPTTVGETYQVMMAGEDGQAIWKWLDYAQPYNSNEYELSPSSLNVDINLNVLNLSQQATLVCVGGTTTPVSVPSGTTPLMYVDLYKGDTLYTTLTRVLANSPLWIEPPLFTVYQSKNDIKILQTIELGNNTTTDAKPSRAYTGITKVRLRIPNSSFINGTMLFEFIGLNKQQIRG